MIEHKLFTVSNEECTYVLFREVTMLTSTQELNTNQAAELLGVSRPFLVSNLLEAGVIPFHYVGSHRRIYLTDLMACREEKARQRALLDEMGLTRF